MRYCTLTETHNLRMMDTEYVTLAAQGYDPNLECQLKIPTHLFGTALQISRRNPEHN
ncbi:hypothetical protein [Nostoc flagelliforme]|nr:hypothetical protein [Nostoc flagelliforme]